MLHLHQDSPSTPPPPPANTPPRSTDPIRFLPYAALFLHFPPPTGPDLLSGLPVPRREREDPRPRLLRASAMPSPPGDPRAATRPPSPGRASRLLEGPRISGPAHQYLQSVPFQDGEWGEILAWPKEEGFSNWGFLPSFETLTF